jgi:hypothetical protein
MDGAIVMLQEATDQGHLEAARFVGSIYAWGQGVAIDFQRAMAAYKVLAEGGDAVCQYHVGFMYYTGHGVDVDYKQALPWIEKAAAQEIAKCRLHDRCDVLRGKRHGPELAPRTRVQREGDRTGQLHGGAEHAVDREGHSKCRPSHGQAGGDPRREPRKHERQPWHRHRLPLVQGRGECALHDKARRRRGVQGQAGERVRMPVQISYSIIVSSATVVPLSKLMHLGARVVSPYTGTEHVI